MVKTMKIRNTRKFILFIFTKPLIIIFTVLTLIFPMYQIIYLGFTYTSKDLFFFIFEFITVFGVILNFFKITNKKRIFKIFGELGFYILFGNFASCIISIPIVLAIAGSVTSFSIDLGLYFTIAILVLITIESFLSDRITRTEVAHISEHIDLEEKIKEKSEKAQKVKKGLKIIGKTAGKIAVETIGDKISEATGNEVTKQLTQLTGNTNIGELAGKLTEKGIAKVTEYAADKVTDKIFGTPQETPLEQKITITDIKNRLLGIIKSKKRVNLDYIEKFIKLAREEIIGLIYNLIGEGEIEGTFNFDDTIFTLNNQKQDNPIL